MKTRTAYVCSACKASTPRWQGRCPQCQAWNTLEAQLQSGPAQGPAANRPVDLRALPPLLEERVSSQLFGNVSLKERLM